MDSLPEVEGWAFEDGLRVAPDVSGDYDGRFEATNTSDQWREPLFNVVLRDGSRELGNLSCGGFTPIRPGTTTTVDCISLDAFEKGWTDIDLTWDGTERNGDG